MTHLAYKGAGPALNDVVGGQVPIILDNLPSSLTFIKAGRLVPIVVAAPERLKQLPDVPTFKEVGLEPVNRMAWYGVYGPKGLPIEIVNKLHGAIKKTLDQANVRARIEERRRLSSATRRKNSLSRSRPNTTSITRSSRNGRSSLNSRQRSAWYSSGCLDALLT